MDNRLPAVDRSVTCPREHEFDVYQRGVTVTWVTRHGAGLLPAPWTGFLQNERCYVDSVDVPGLWANIRESVDVATLALVSGHVEC